MTAWKRKRRFRPGRANFVLAVIQEFKLPVYDGGTVDGYTRFRVRRKHDHRRKAGVGQSVIVTPET